MIIWFSGSGNSLAIARKIADKTGEQILPIYEAVRMDLSAEKRIGLVFPTYWLDAPLAIKALVPRLQLPKDAYTFIVITCGAQTNNAVWTVRRILKSKGVRLDYCNKIRVPDTSALAFGRNPNDQAWKLSKYAPRLERIIADIQAGKRGLHYSGFDPVGWLLNLGNDTASSYKRTLPYINADKCIGCGICTKVCPQGNIKLTDNKAVMADDCTLCLACLHNCPQQAVEVNGRPTLKENQYRHPDVKVKDLMR